uniref:Uncharacterized protein n=1 Tax=Hubei diptera virus 21 TaxID=1922882 RepID=A0A1L3KPA7_9VIRU|nr:hypothetical protein 3 [Hubei diptera virus 21]
MFARLFLYPLNFDFSNELILQHLPIPRYLSDLQVDNLITLDFESGELNLKFNHVFSSLGFKYNAFEVTEMEGSDKTLRELMRGVVRIRKTTREPIAYNNTLFLNILKNEDRLSPVLNILNKFHELIVQLRISGSDFVLKMNSNTDVKYVSYLLASYWIERWYTFEGVTSSEDFWSVVTYDGTLSQLKEKLCFMLKLDHKGFWITREIYYPRGKYVLIRNVMENYDSFIPMYDFKIEFIIKNSILLDDLIEYINAQPHAILHIIPHYFIYHVHKFDTEESMIKYLEWSVLRAQKDVASYTNSVINMDGLRFTRGAILSNSATSYMKFLNVLLWNSYDFEIPVSDDSFQWKALLRAEFNNFITKYDLHDLFPTNTFPAPKYLREYVCNFLNNFQPQNEIQVALRKILENYLFVTYDGPFPVPQLKTLGRVNVSSGNSQIVTFSEIPSNGIFSLLNLSYIQFTQEKLSMYNYKNVNPRTRSSFIGGIITAKSARVEVSIEVESVLRAMQSVREGEVVRALVRKLCPFETNAYAASLANLYLKSIPAPVSFWYGLFLHFSKAPIKMDEIDTDVNEDGVSFGLQVKLHSYTLRKEVIIYNASTPKILGVCDTLFSYLGVNNRETVTIGFTELKKIFSRTLVLGSVDRGDPIGTILEKFFNVSVKQVGALGSGRVIRSEASHFEFAVSYTSVISDMDIAMFSSVADLDSFLINVIFHYMSNILPELGIWKINYCTYEVSQYIMNLVTSMTTLGNIYVILFITPQFGKVLNYERYLIFFRRPIPLEDVTSLLVPNLPTSIENVVEARRVERQIKDLNELLLMRDDAFPRLYLFAQSESAFLQSCLTLFSHRVSHIIVAKGHGTQYISYYGMISPIRLRLCMRVDHILQMSNLALERFDVSSYGSSAFRYQKDVNILGLGNYYREMSRLLILTDLEGLGVLDSLTSFIEYSDELHYVGVGDERVRNILCVPIYSPYTVYDLKTYEHLTAFNVIFEKRFFPMTSLTAMVSEVEQLYEKYNKPLVIFFTFMLFNVRQSADELLETLGFIFELRKLFPEIIYRIYFNVYLDSREFPDKRHFTSDHSLALFNDIYLKLAEEKLSGTFSQHYDYVELITTSQLIELAREHEVEIRALNMTPRHVDFMLWNLNFGLDPADCSGLHISQSFIPMLVLD